MEAHRLTELDEAGTFERLKVHGIELIEPAIDSHGCSIVKLMGMPYFLPKTQPRQKASAGS
jgi:hypothetical protein